ncbi:MAG: hypothetical protein J6B24_05660, partial [Clostridia bacterium]|nr:hypothetical protein [Clostridia bacterium]
MSVVFEHGAIIDRINETKTVEAIIKKNINNQKAHAIVIWADSGYGKSAIMQKVMVSLNNQSIHVIIVDTPPTNTTTPIEGQYLNYIAEAINTALQDEFPIESFLYSSQSVVQPMIDSDQIIQSGHTLQSGAIAKIGNIMLSDLKARRLLYDTSVDSIIVLRDYIESTLRLFPVVLDITNAQNMDSTSFRIIKNIIQNIPKIVIAFEYTTKDNDSQDMIRFVTDLNCPYTTIEINELPFDFALSIFGVPDDPNKILEIERFYKDVVKGNLYRIMQAKADSKGNGILYCEDPIEKKIQSLNYSNKLVLYILCLHDGELALSTLTDIISFVTDYFYISESWKNDLDSLIVLTLDHIKLRHASIKDAQPMSLDNAVAMTAYRYLVLYYENLKNSSRDHNIQKQSVIWLVRLHSYFDPIRMIPLLEEFKQVVICNLSEIDAFLMIKQAFDALGEKIETEYHYRLIALCYEAGFYRGALTLLNELGEITTECGKTYMCMLLNRNDYHQEAISKCQLFLKTVKNLRYRMILLMVKMLSERSLGLDKSYISTFYEIERKQEFKSLLEYGFLLRNAQIVLSYSDSLPYLQRSIDFFNQRDEKTYMAHSQLTYLIQAARLGY